MPDDGNVFFFFNPFIGATLSEVIHRIHRSWCSHPRDLFVIFFNHREFDQCVQSHYWLRKVHETAFCGLYRDDLNRYWLRARLSVLLAPDEAYDWLFLKLVKIKGIPCTQRHLRLYPLS